MEEKSFNGVGIDAFETSGGLSQQERELFKKEQRSNATVSLTTRLEELRNGGGPEMLAVKYERELADFLNERGGVEQVTLSDCKMLAQDLRLGFEPIVILAAALEAEERRKKRLQ